MSFGPALGLFYFAIESGREEKREGLFRAKMSMRTKQNVFVSRSAMHKMSYYDGYEINEAKLTQMVQKN